MVQCQRKIGKPAEANKLHIGGMEIDQTNTCKYLGVTINNSGTMQDHINKLNGKADASLYNKRSST